MKRNAIIHSRGAAIAVPLLLFAAIAACGPASEEGTGPAEVPVQPTAESAPAATRPETAFPCIDGDPAAGKRQYNVFCTSCHGARGEGDGPAAAALQPRPARHADGTYMNALSNDHLFKVIKRGGIAVGKSPLMAPWGGPLSDQQIWDLVAFLRSLSQPAYSCP